MNAMRKASVALTKDEWTLLKAAVDAGEYATPSDIVSEAIREWQINREKRSGDVKRLRQLWDEGKASGSAEPFDIESIVSEAKRRFDNANVG